MQDLNTRCRRPYTIATAVGQIHACNLKDYQDQFCDNAAWTGTAVAMQPKSADVEAMEESNAKETLQEFPAAAGAYDRVPFASASAVWTLDTSTDIFLLHSVQVRRWTSILPD